jgi:hypothetical protein
MKTKIFLAVSLLIGSIATTSLLAPAPTYAAKCGGANTAIISCTQTNPKGGSLETNGIWGLLLLVLNIMTAGVGVLAIGGIVYGSIRIASAGDNSANVKKGVNMILNVVGGLIAYVAMYALLQYLIPGGVFTG